MRPDPPQSQKADVRPIAFVLDDQTEPQPRPIVLTLYIRPEELSRTDPSRLAVHHTAGGAFADSFGPGVATISLSGTTGWRRASFGGAGLDATSDDGADRFQALHEQVFTGWHGRRRVAVAAGRDPSGVKLVLADSLDRFAVVVAPQSFTLRRSKQRPLVSQFQIQLVVIERKLEQFYAVPPPPVNLPAGIESLQGSIVRLAEYAPTLPSLIGGTMGTAARTFLEQTQAIYRLVADEAAKVDGVASSLIEVARMTGQAGANLFRSLTVIQGLPARALSRLMEVASEFTNVVCVLSNSLRRRTTYTDYSPLYGSSNCSSTNGGQPPSPLAGVNPFFALAPASIDRAMTTVTQNAQAALRSLAQADTVLTPVPLVALSGLVQSINGGLALR